MLFLCQLLLNFHFLLIPPMIIGGGLEEIGWRGFLQPELEKRMPHSIATIIVGMIWSILAFTPVVYRWNQSTAEHEFLMVHN